MATIIEHTLALECCEAYTGEAKNATARREPPVAWPNQIGAGRHVE